MSFDPNHYLMNLKGKQYLPVAPRIAWMREEHPDWGIITEEVIVTDTYARFRSTIMDEGGRVIATATKCEDRVGFPDFVEKAETGSIGRALALCGYGTLQCLEFDEGERFADSPIERNARNATQIDARNATQIERNAARLEPNAFRQSGGRGRPHQGPVPARFGEVATEAQVRMIVAKGGTAHVGMTKRQANTEIQRLSNLAFDKGSAAMDKGSAAMDKGTGRIRVDDLDDPFSEGSAGFGGGADMVHQSDRAQPADLVHPTEGR